MLLGAKDAKQYSFDQLRSNFSAGRRNCASAQWLCTLSEQMGQAHFHQRLLNGQEAEDSMKIVASESIFD
jgi:hypothetical protein